MDVDFEFYVYYSRNMEIQQAIIIFDALSQETRLRAFRLLVEAGSEGMPAGALSEELGTPHNTLSFHLNHLANAGVVSSRRQGRSIIYTANFSAMHGLVNFMVEDCCSRKFASIRNDEMTGRSLIELHNCCESQAKK